jgi:DivIVA domain-containing protein
VPPGRACEEPSGVTLVYVLAGIAVIAVVALLAVGRLGELPDVEPDRAPLALPEDRPMDRDDVDAVRFAVGMRGYRMDEVDDVLDRLASDIDERDARIALLEHQLFGNADDPSAYAAPRTSQLTKVGDSTAAGPDPATDPHRVEPALAGHDGVGAAADSAYDEADRRTRDDTGRHALPAADDTD